MSKQNKGFTLIELLVVIAIIGILSAIGLVALTGAQAKARDVKRKADLGSLNSSLTLYLDANTAFPIADRAAAAPGDGPLLTSRAAASNLKTAAAAAGGFALPRTPGAGTASVSDYWYITDATGAKFGLFTRLENTAAWFVSNSKGFSDVILSANAAAPAAANTECLDTAGGGAFIYSPCLSAPVM